MSSKSTGSKASSTRHSAEYKQESLKLAIHMGVAKAEKQLGIHDPNVTAQSDHIARLSPL